MADVLPFPLTRRRALIRRHAKRIATSSSRTGEKLLAHLLRQQAQSLARKGLPEEVIAAEVKALESAIRAELWRGVMQPDGAA